MESLMKEVFSVCTVGVGGGGGGGTYKSCLGKKCLCVVMAS